MKNEVNVHKKRWLVLVVILVIAAIDIYQHTKSGFSVEMWLRLSGILFISYSVWRLGGKYEQKYESYNQLLHEKEQIKDRLMVVSNKKEEYENLFNSLDGAIYSFDLSNQDIYYSAGINEVYGYSQDAFKDHHELWKEMVHEEDVTKVEEAEKQLLTGETVRVEYRILHPELGQRWLIKISSPTLNKDGILTKINGQFMDITDRKELENKLKQMAYYDELTDLPNRKYLYSYIRKALARAKRSKHNFSLMFIDLDDFKIVNDTMGHEVGDKLLKAVVNRINDCIREEDLIARIGGDEFIVVFEETTKDQIEVISSRLFNSVALPYTIDENEVNISVSIGISMYPDDGEDKETLIDHADKAMYFAKSTGKNNYKIYTHDLHEVKSNNIGLLEKLMNTIQNSKIFK
ncbi:sensor domain-containing diguanylate cyclase [Desertibacillus haloalkaliphilus]|uniref:sensor domain-containing diguanylate cyclase n=1 Tax=Desertibacillus haloalkaliphilus TaxID=1328930 RepID=UPI001FE4422C|nr:sensor domain-containing diguanylate cyclase [Desertibacillus haloalkaliphilus]